jgi:hypothetical protein
MPRTLSLATLLNPVVFASVYFKNYSERANFKSSCPITMGNNSAGYFEVPRSVTVLRLCASLAVKFPVNYTNKKGNIKRSFLDCMEMITAIF